MTFEDKCILRDDGHGEEAVMQGSEFRGTVDSFALNMVSTEGLQLSVGMQTSPLASAAFAVIAQHCEVHRNPCWKGQVQQFAVQEPL